VANLVTLPGIERGAIEIGLMLPPIFTLGHGIQNYHLQIKVCRTGLPDGLFSNQKFQFG
jgi:hypothetical protein